MHFLRRFDVCGVGLLPWNSHLVCFFYCALLVNNHRQRWAEFVEAFAVCFVGFSDCAGIGGLTASSCGSSLGAWASPRGYSLCDRVLQICFLADMGMGHPRSPVPKGEGPVPPACVIWKDHRDRGHPPARAGASSAIAGCSGACSIAGSTLGTALAFFRDAMASPLC